MSHVATYRDKRQVVPMPYAPGGCPVKLDGEKCGETQGLDIIKDFHQLYEEKMSEIDVSAGGDSLQEKVDLQQKWINDLTEQNKMLAKVIEELETEAIGRLQQLENQLKNAAKSFGEVIFYLNHDLKSLLEFIRRIREQENWSINGLFFYEVSWKDLFGTACRPKILNNKKMDLPEDTMSDVKSINLSFEEDQEGLADKDRKIRDLEEALMGQPIAVNDSNDKRDNRKESDREKEENREVLVGKSDEYEELDNALEELTTGISRNPNESKGRQEQQNKERPGGKDRENDEPEFSSKESPSMADGSKETKSNGRQEQDTEKQQVGSGGLSEEFEFVSNDLTTTTEISKDNKEPFDGKERKSKEFTSTEMPPSSEDSKGRDKEKDRSKEDNKEPFDGKERKSKEFATREMPPSSDDSNGRDKEKGRSKEGGIEESADENRTKGENEKESSGLVNTIDDSNRNNEENDVLKQNMERFNSILTEEIANKQDIIHLLEREIIKLEEKINESQKEASLKDDLIKELRKELKKMRHKQPYTDREKVTSNVECCIPDSPGKVSSEPEFITLNHSSYPEGSNNSTLIFIRNNSNDHTGIFESSDSSECGLNESMAIKNKGLVHSCSSENNIKEISWMRPTKERSKLTKINRYDDMERNEFDRNRRQNIKKLSIPKHIPVKTHVNNIEYIKDLQ